MSRVQVSFVIVLALAIGYAGGYFTHIVRFPMRHQHPELFAKGAAEKAPGVAHPIVQEVEKARRLYADGKPLEAQRILREQLIMYPQASEARAARELLGTINTELFFANDSLYGKTEYVVERGDSLARIAHQLNSTPEMIMRANALDSSIIHPGDRLVVPDGDFTLTIDLPKQRVVVHHGDGFFKQYPIQSIELPRSSQPKVSTKVTAITLWKDGKRIAPSSADAGEGTPWVYLSQPGYILYGVSEEGGVEPAPIEISESKPSSMNAAPAAAQPNPDAPAHGIALLKDDLAELQLLLRRGTPVTIIRERK